MTTVALWSSEGYAVSRVFFTRARNLLTFLVAVKIAVCSEGPRAGMGFGEKAICPT